MKQIGFTGTREGMTDEQRQSLENLFRNAPGNSVLHHGDCIGSDEQAAKQADGFKIATVCHPPKSNKLRAFHDSAFTREPLPYLKRDDAIVNESEVLIAAPCGFVEEVRSGTWYTVRRAREKGIKIYIIWPDGRVEVENRKDG